MIYSNHIIVTFSLYLLLSFQSADANDEVYRGEIRPLLVKYCGDCHSPENADAEEGVQFLKAENIEQISQFRSLWSSSAEQLRNRTMPPAEETQPSEQERLRLAEWISQTLYETACKQGPYAGSVTSRRLNRLEYANTIRDLLGVETDAAIRFPIDGSGGEGFNNNGETLFLPPLLLERYLEAADQILQQAIPAKAIDITLPANQLEPVPETEAGPRTLMPKESIRFQPRIYAAGSHDLKVSVQMVDQPTRLAVKVDGLVAERFQVETKPSAEGQFPIELACSIQLTKGFHTIQFTCIGENSLQLTQIRLSHPQPDLNDQQREWIRKLTGMDHGQSPQDARTTASESLQRFLIRAFRRAITEDELAKYLQLYDRASERGDPYAEALKLAMKGVLVSSPFLFRVETLADSEKLQLLSDYELASRLSYFLWGTMPDEELSRLAGAGQLQQSDVLIGQVKRLLNDPRSRYFVEEFVGQWLRTKEVGASIVPDTGKFQGQFSTELLLGFREEPLQLFAYLLEKNRPAIEFITADYVIVNSRLEKQYGLTTSDEVKTPSWPWTTNPELSADGPFQKVQIEDGRRGGVLGMGGVHLLTSYPNRTSPVLRGGWILETLLGVHIPNPPPDVPELSKSKKKGVTTVREQLALHRDHATCAACHNLIDPPGFALDHYDLLGRWQDEQQEQPVNATATFPSGETVTGLPGLKQIMQSRKEEFYRQLTRKMLGFALGRSLNDRDDCVINQLSDQMLHNDETLRSLVESIVLSTPFRYKQLTAD